MADATRNLGLPLLAAAQAQKHVTHNEALVQLDALIQLACLDKDLSAPPAAPAEGDRYLVAAGGPTGAWAGLSGQIVRYEDGAWIGTAPRAGFLAFVLDEADLYLFTGSMWASFRSTLTAFQNLSRLGVGTQADAVNRLAVKSEAALFSWDDVTPGAGNMRQTLNKKAPANDAGLVFQTGYSTRALLGTFGGDDLSLKTSSDGAAFHTALVAAAATGAIDFPLSPTAPTAGARSNSRALATTAYVDRAVKAGRTSFVDVFLNDGSTAYGAAFARLPLASVNEDAGGNWDAQNFWYVCPRDGLYQITGSLRVGAAGDTSTYNGAQYGLGVYTAEQDGPWFLWHSTRPNGAQATRSTYAYARLSRQRAGDRLRMFTYSDHPGGVVMYRAGLQIVLVAED